MSDSGRADPTVEAMAREVVALLLPLEEITRRVTCQDHQRVMARLRQFAAAVREQCAAKAETMARRHEECPPGCKCADGYHIAAAIRRAQGGNGV